MIHALYSEYDDICTLIEMVDEEEDRSMVKEIEKDIAHFEEDFEKLRIETLLSGEYDSCNAIMTLHAGTGGTEACDWVNMLYRMYTRWFQTKGFSVQVLDYLDGDITGIKNITFEVVGDNAYGYLKSEKGVHRLVRISPFNAAGKRQTSFVQCDVMPDIEEDLDVEIDPDDLRIDTFRSSGAGGQHVNKTDSAIRITHLPTNIVVTCQNEKSQLQNKEAAFKVLRAKLYELERRKREEELSALRGERMENSFGSQIRNYVLYPYQMVKDLRSNIETGSVDAVLDGDIEQFVIGYHRWRVSQ